MPQQTDREPSYDARVPGTSNLHAALEQVLELLACPACHAPLRATATSITCTGCARRYPVEDGIPILLIDRALPGV